jgi:hypothetical protein
MIHDFRRTRNETEMISFKSLPRNFSGRINMWKFGSIPPGQLVSRSIIESVTSWMQVTNVILWTSLLGKVSWQRHWFVKMKWRISQCYKFTTTLKVDNPTSTKKPNLFHYKRTSWCNTFVNAPISYALNIPTCEFDVRGKLFHYLEKKNTNYS